MLHHENDYKLLLPFNNATYPNLDEVASLKLLPFLLSNAYCISLKCISLLNANLLACINKKALSFT